MVIVVEPLSHGINGYEHVLGWIDAFIIRSHSPHMCSTVNKPGHVEGEHISRHGANAEGCEKSLVPEVPRDNSWECESNKDAQRYEELVLEPDNWVCLQI